MNRPERARAIELRSESLEVGYRDMARDKKREAEALEWSEATVGNENLKNRMGKEGA